MLCAALSVVLKTLTDLSHLVDGRKGWVTERVCCHKAIRQTIQIVWTIHRVARTFSQLSAPFVTPHNGSCEQFCTCLRASKKDSSSKCLMSFLGSHILPLPFALHHVHRLRLHIPCCAGLESVCPLVTPLCEHADRLSESPTTHSSQVTSPTRLIPCSASTSAVTTRQSAMLYDGKISTLRMISKFAVPRTQEAVSSQRSVANTCTSVDEFGIIVLHKKTTSERVRVNHGVILKRRETNAFRRIRCKRREKLVKAKLKSPLKKKRKLGEGYLMLKLILKTEIGNRENPAFFETHRELDYQNMELLQASQWADAAPREREGINLCGEMEMRNRLRYESHVRTSQEIEELRRMCYEEANQVRRLQNEDLSLRTGGRSKYCESTSEANASTIAG